MSAASQESAAPGSAVDNRVVWDRRPGRYEVWFLTFNHRPSESGFWIRYSLTAPIPGRGAPYSQLWFARFDGRDPGRNFGINRKFPVEELRAGASPFSIAIGDTLLGHGEVRGGLAGGGHEASWDLAFAPAASTVRILPDWAHGQRVEAEFLAPHFTVPLTGRIRVDGEDYRLAGDRGAQCHIWGRKHAYSHAWAHVCEFPDHHDAAIDVLAPQLRRKGLVLPRLTIATLKLDGEVVHLNAPWHMALARAEVRSGSFRFATGSPTVKIEGEFTARPGEMIATEYADPDGEPAFCNNTEVGSARLTVQRRTLLSLSLWREAARLYAPQLAHFEILGRRPDPAVERRHVTV